MSTTTTTITHPDGTTICVTTTAAPAPEPAPVADEPITKIVSCKYGTGEKVTVAMCEADFTPAWVSNVLNTEVKSFNTKLCSQGQVGVTVLILDIEYAEPQQPSMPTSFAVKMHGPGEEQRKNSGAMGLYFKEIYAYHDFNIAKNVPLICPEVLGIWYDAREYTLLLPHFCRATLGAARERNS
jgi:hypothetical protein